MSTIKRNQPIQYLVTLIVTDDGRPEYLNVGEISDILHGKAQHQSGIDILVKEFRALDAPEPPRRVWVVYDEEPPAHVFATRELAEEFLHTISKFADRMYEVAVQNDLRSLRRKRALAKLTAEDREALGLEEE